VAEASGKYARIDVILPSQYFGTARKLTPEERLMVAVLDDALDCLVKHRLATDQQSRQLFEETRQWLLAVDSDWPYSFRGICGILNLDAGAVLRNLRIEPEANLSVPGVG
jgi:hypothetical protein